MIPSSIRVLEFSRIVNDEISIVDGAIALSNVVNHMIHLPKEICRELWSYHVPFFHYL